MVHWGRPTTPAMARRHKLQLALLLEMDKTWNTQFELSPDEEPCKRKIRARICLKDGV